MSKPRVVDVFLFNDEFDMLQLRLDELKPQVDEFVLVEASFTFSGLEKPCLFQERAHEFANYPITALSVPNPGWPPTTSPWSREGYCRNYASAYLQKTCGDTDIIMLSDLDEIPDFRSLDLPSLTLPTFLVMDMFYYNFNCYFEKERWKGTVLFNKAALQRSSLVALRMDKYSQAPKFPTIQCGWHLSYFMTPQKIADKLRDFSHQEYNNDKYNQLDYIRECIDNKASIFNKDPKRPKDFGTVYTGQLPRTYDQFPDFMKAN